MSIRMLGVVPQKTIQTDLVRYFTDFGHSFFPVSDLFMARDLLSSRHRFDILLWYWLDTPAAVLSSFLDACQKTRYLGVIVLLPIKNQDQALGQRISLLELGADDVLVCPYSHRELLARIKAIYRRLHQGRFGPTRSSYDTDSQAHHSGDLLYFGDRWFLDRNQRQVYDASGTDALLTTGEYRLLEALIGAPHQLLTRDQLVYRTSSSTSVTTDRAVDILISRIRKKLADDLAHPWLIKTVRGCGYIFVAQVTQVSNISASPLS